MKSLIHLSSKFYSKLSLQVSWIFISISVVGAIPGSAARGGSPEFVIHSACTPQENWKINDRVTDNISREYVEEFYKFLSRKTSFVRGFSEAMALGRSAPTPLAAIFAQYWVSRALLEGGLTEIAINGFNSIVSDETFPQGWAIQLAAMDCIEKISNQHRALFFNRESMDQIPNYFSQKATSSKVSTILSEGLLQVFLSEIENSKPIISLRTLANLNPSGGVYKRYIDGIMDVHEGRIQGGIQKLSVFYNPKFHFPEFIDRQRDGLKLIVARLNYEIGNYKEAIHLFKSVDKKSNELPDALEALAWAQLLSKDYASAIGTGIGVQTGWMKHTFIPEALMVATMALNELCHFPEALRVLSILRREYKGIFQWLKSYNDAPKESKTKLYPLALRYLKNDPTLNLPSRIINEWVRSPVFIAYQDGINVLIRQEKSVEKWIDAAEEEQTTLVSSVLDYTLDFRRKYDEARSQANGGSPWTPALIKDFQEFKKELAHYRRFLRASRLWRSVLTNAHARVKQTQEQWTARIENEFSWINIGMYQNLQWVFENSDLIEVEILNSAGDDIIRKNAERENPKLAKRNKREEPTQLNPKAASEVYQWGSSSVSLSGTGEIWDDELDSLSANLTSKCAQYPKRKK